MFARIEAGLRDVLLTARPVYVGATSATGFMEMAIRNVREGRSSLSSTAVSPSASPRSPSRASARSIV